MARYLSYDFWHLKLGHYSEAHFRSVKWPTLADYSFLISLVIKILMHSIRVGGALVFELTGLPVSTKSGKSGILIIWLVSIITSLYYTKTIQPLHPNLCSGTYVTVWTFDCLPPGGSTSRQIVRRRRRGSRRAASYWSRRRHRLPAIKVTQRHLPTRRTKCTPKSSDAKLIFRGHQN